MPDSARPGSIDVEELLADLAVHLDWPALPDPVAAARNRIAAGDEPASPRAWWDVRRRPWALAAAVAALVIALVLVIPGTRQAVADFLGLGGITVRNVPPSTTVESTAPPTDVSRLGLGTPVTLEAARAMADSPIFVPKELGDPDAVYVTTANGHSMFTLLYEPRPGLPRAPQTTVGLLITEFTGRFAPYIEKQVSTGQAEEISIGGQPALWVQGPHTLLYQDESGDVKTSESRLAANTLVVSRGGTTIRLEGAIDQATAIRLVNSLG